MKVLAVAMHIIATVATNGATDISTYWSNE